MADASDFAMRQRLKSIVGGSAGNPVEWHGRYAHAAFTRYFAPHFFPHGDRTTQLPNAAAVFAVGFPMRPIGGWPMGVHADRHGRKADLTLSVSVSVSVSLSVSLMCAGSLLIAVTPGHATIGWIAPALLALARLGQGLSLANALFGGTAE